MSLTLDELVPLSTRRSNPGGPTPPTRRVDFLMSDFNRRHFLKLIMAAGTGAGMAIIGWLPPTRHARASHSPYTVQETCSNVSYASTGSCTGCSRCCSDVSSTYCGSDNWHRHDAVSIGGDTVDYRLRMTSCNGNNAWKWTVSDCCSGRKNRRYRCSDGQKSINGGAWVDTVCPHQFSGSGSSC